MAAKGGDFSGSRYSCVKAGAPTDVSYFPLNHIFFQFKTCEFEVLVAHAGCLTARWTEIATVRLTVRQSVRQGFP